MAQGSGDIMLTGVARHGVIGVPFMTQDLVEISLRSGGHICGKVTDIGHSVSTSGHRTFIGVTLGRTFVPWSNIRAVRLVQRPWPW